MDGMRSLSSCGRPLIYILSWRASQWLAGGAVVSVPSVPSVGTEGTHLGLFPLQERL